MGCIFSDENVNVTYVQDDIQTLSPTQIDTNDKKGCFHFSTHLATRDCHLVRFPVRIMFRSA